MGQLTRSEGFQLTTGGLSLCTEFGVATRSR